MGGEEYSHHRAGGGDAEKDCNCPCHPSQFQRRLATQAPCPKEREQKETVEEQDRRAFHPTANGIIAHRVGSNTDDCSKRKQKAFGPGRTGEPPKVDKRSQNDKSQCRNNMRQGENCMRCECGIERGQLRWRRLRWVRKRNRTPKYHGHGNHNAGPKPDAQPAPRSLCL